MGGCDPNFFRLESRFCHRTWIWRRTTLQVLKSSAFYWSCDLAKLYDLGDEGRIPVVFFVLFRKLVSSVSFFV